MKLWQKNTDANQAVDRFTVGHDREMDLFLAEADVLGSLAHTRMLNSIGLLGDEDLQAVQRELKKIHADIVAGRFTIDEGIEDDHSQVELHAAYRICNKNPLGSAAGYGSSFPLNRTMTTELLGFDTLSYNVVYAQMGRGKTERIMAQAMSSVAATLARLAMDNTMFLNQNFNFISYPAELTTGSSIMPHKKNPDVWELIRGKCNLIQGLPNQIAMMTTNLPIGYNRDLQQLKEVLFPAVAELRSCLQMAHYMLENLSVKEDILNDPKYDYLFSVEVVNDLVLHGTPFREAYKKVGLDIENGTFKAPHTVHHTHEGSIGNLCTQQIAALMDAQLARFHFERVEAAEAALVQP